MDTSVHRITGVDGAGVSVITDYIGHIHAARRRVAAVGRAPVAIVTIDGGARVFRASGWKEACVFRTGISVVAVPVGIARDLVLASIRAAISVRINGGVQTSPKAEPDDHDRIGDTYIPTAVQVGSVGIASRTGGGIAIEGSCQRTEAHQNRALDIHHIDESRSIHISDGLQTSCGLCGLRGGQQQKYNAENCESVTHSSSKSRFNTLQCRGSLFLDQSKIKPIPPDAWRPSEEKGGEVPLRNEIIQGVFPLGSAGIGRTGSSRADETALAYTDTTTRGAVERSRERQ